jgi:hypothetical protein
LAVTTSYDLFKLKMLPEMRTVFEHVMQAGRFWAGSGILELADPTTRRFWANRADDLMWGRIILRSAASEGGLESATAQAAWLDEVGQDSFRLEDWEAVLRRLSLNRGRILGTTTVYNSGWLKSEIYDRWQSGDQDIDVIQFPSVMNPSFPAEEFERARRTMPDWRFSMFYRGEFRRPPGLIYNEFRETMLDEPFIPPLHWPRVVGIDFGGVNNAAVFLAQDPETEIWHAYEEVLEGNLTSTEKAERIKRRLVGCSNPMVYGGSLGERQDRRDWSSAGLLVMPPAIDSVRAGVDKVVGLFKTGKLRVGKHLRGLRDELGSYSYKLDEDGAAVDQILDARAYHRLDALRYAVVGITYSRISGKVFF